MTRQQATSSQSESELAPDLDAVIVGAGFAGLYMLYRARDVLGIRARVYEAGDGVGGTWYWNRNGIGAVEGAIDSLFDRVPDVKFDEATIFTTGDLGFIMAHATGTAMTGERVDAHTCDIYEFSDGQVVKVDSYWKSKA